MPAVIVVLFFFFSSRRRHTRWPRDWSSDVCSSDLTSLKSVPSELYEAATLDGCTEIQIATRIKVPMILPSLIMTAVFSIIATLQVFAEPMLLRPLTNSISTTRSEEHTSELQSRGHLVCRLLLDKKKTTHLAHTILLH